MDWYNKIINTLTGKRKDEPIEDILLKNKGDRRIFPHVPDPMKQRKGGDRRGASAEEAQKNMGERQKVTIAGARFSVNFVVHVRCVLPAGERKNFTCQSVDVSTTGMLIRLKGEEQYRWLHRAKRIHLAFQIPPGSMPEGMEMKVKVTAEAVRFQVNADGVWRCGLKFNETLAQYAGRRKNANMVAISTTFLFAMVFIIILMRAESVIYFKFNKFLYSYSIITAVFLLTRYLFGSLYRAVPVDMEYTPGVTIVIPCFNEEEWIHRTIRSCIDQDYPSDKLEVIVVDDCSNDQSVAVIKATIEELTAEGERFHVGERLSYLVQKENKGKREALCRGVLKAKHELVVFVDSDSFLDPFAIRNLVQPFQDPKMGGVAGRTDVANTYTNGLTKMQSVRYYIAFRIMKAAESYFDAVTCLSGPLSCYKKQIVLDHMDEWINQRFLGQKATFGDDRAMTNFVLRHHRTTYQDTAVCSTIVPNRHKTFLKQQMRWKRSWLRESITAAGFIWRKEPFMALFFYIGVLVPIAAPVVVVYNLLYVPIAYGIVPTTFLLGLLTMAMLMSFAQMFFRRSSTWLYGLWFCIYYEAVLLWQMPVAWVTFWKSTWGTRMTPADIQAEERREERKRAEDEYYGHVIGQ
ncbi:MAG: glycosyltransferase [Candidatus Pelethousia sp.]|nr:glycosyltransferase [Candidatus Pelethousia sp.]